MNGNRMAGDSGAGTSADDRGEAAGVLTIDGLANLPMKRTKANGLQLSADGQLAGPRGRRTGPASAPRGPAVVQSTIT